MSTFYYKKPFDREPKLAVRCDGCKTALFTDYEGQSFPEHITVSARAAKWVHTKERDRWKDYCPECEAYRRGKIRERTFARQVGTAQIGGQQ